MPDETVTSDSSAPSPGADGAGSSPAPDTAALGGSATEQAGQSTQTGTPAQGTEAPTAGPTDDEKYALPDSADIATLRERYKALNTDFRTFKQTAEPLNAWKTLSEQYQTPEQIQPMLKISEGLFAPRLNAQGQQEYVDGIPATTTLPALQVIHEQSPNTLIQLADDLANFTVQGRPIIDWQFDAYLADRGMSVADLDGFQAWKANGGQSVANNSDIAPEDLESIPPQYRDVFKNMPPDVRSDLLLSNEATRDYMLRAAKAEADNQSWRQQQETEQKKAGEAAQQRQAQEIQSAQETAVSDIWSSTFKSLTDDLVSKGWKPSADDGANTFQHGMVISAIHAMTHPALAPILLPMFEAAGIKVDSEKIGSLLNQVDDATRRLVLYEKTGDQMQASRAKADRDRAQFQLKTLATGVSAQAMGVLDGSAAERRNAEQSRISGATSRPVLTGQATNGTSNGIPAGAKPFGSEFQRAAAQLVQQR